MKIAKYFIVALLCSAVVWGATKGDQQPFAKYGRVLVQAYDAGTLNPTNIPTFSNQNAISVVNNGNLDGGSSTTVYCGFDTSVTPSNGYTVSVGSSLSIDLVSVSQGTPVSPTDGGTNAIAPKLYCVAAPGILSEMDVRYIVVK